MFPPAPQPFPSGLRQGCSDHVINIGRSTSMQQQVIATSSVLWARSRVKATAEYQAGATPCNPSCSRIPRLASLRGATYPVQHYQQHRYVAHLGYIVYSNCHCHERAKVCEGCKCHLQNRSLLMPAAQSRFFNQCRRLLQSILPCITTAQLAELAGKQ